PYDAISPHHRWGPLRFTARSLADRLGVPGVTSLAVSLNGSGRVAAVAVRWKGGGETVSGRAFAADLSLPSNWFDVRGSTRLPSAGLRPTVDGAAAAAPAAPAWRGEWPAGRRGYTVVLGSIPESAGVGVARSDA